MRPIASVTVDLDPLACYLRKRGLAAPCTGAPDPVYLEGLPRFLELLKALGIRATFFAVGRSVQSGAAADLLRQAASAGHEVANHGQEHMEDLRHLSDQALQSEIQDAAQVISAATGQRPVGFRAPGWNIGPRVLQMLEDDGYQYDSSIVPLPAPALLRLVEPWLVRALPWPILGDQLRWPASPLGPYRMDLEHPWRKGPSRLWEIPGGAAGLFPVPLNFTLHRMIGDRWAPWLGRLARLVPAPLVLVFHGLDLVNHARIAVPGFKKPGLTDPLPEKTARARRTIEAIGRGRIFLPLREIARGLDDGTLV